VTTTTRHYRNFHPKSTTKSRWRQQLDPTAPETKAVQIWIEVPAPSSLVNKMAFAEQQRWIITQQKTFTKWLNTKLETRNLEVKDLVQDLSDGVCHLKLLAVISPCPRPIAVLHRFPSPFADALPC
jgi:hypothetical protein